MISVSVQKHRIQNLGLNIAKIWQPEKIHGPESKSSQWRGRKTVQHGSTDPEPIVNLAVVSQQNIVSVELKKIGRKPHKNT